LLRGVHGHEQVPGRLGTQLDEAVGGGRNDVLTGGEIRERKASAIVGGGRAGLLRSRKFIWKPGGSLQRQPGARDRRARAVDDDGALDGRRRRRGYLRCP